MTNSYLSLKGVSHVLPDGRTLFSELNEQFDGQTVGLVGRNGVGKTVLARILAGLLQPTSGHCLRSGSVHYLGQQVTQAQGSTVADLANVQHRLAALARIEAGSSAAQDFDAVGDHWDIQQRLSHELERVGLRQLEANTPASRLSGGEAMRVSLVGAMLSDADYLILDEPSNHLDRENRQALIDKLQHWPRGLIVVSHDRQLLQSMQRIVELSPQGLHSYGGNYHFYAEAKARQRQSAIQSLDEHKLARQRHERASHKQQERQQQRQARGNRQAKQSNQAKVLLGRQKQRSEHSAGTKQLQQVASRAQLDQRVRDAAHQVEKETEINLQELSIAPPAKRRVAELKDVVLPFVTAATRHISLTLGGQQRMAIIGANGCGKSTLIRVLAAQLAPLAGSCEITTESAYLDQQLGNLDPEKTVLEQLQHANPLAPEGDLRMRLAQLGLEAQKITTASATLSGGERLKTALACILYAESPPQLLLLDEPNNHLDLPSTHALESMLCNYHGALVVVSHDDRFLDNLAITEHLVATDQGWCMQSL